MRAFVTPGSEFLHFSAKAGDGIPDRAIGGSLGKISDDRRRVVGNDPGEGRQVACSVVHDARQFADRLPAFRHCI